MPTVPSPEEAIGRWLATAALGALASAILFAAFTANGGSRPWLQAGLALFVYVVADCAIATLMPMQLGRTPTIQHWIDFAVTALGASVGTGLGVLARKPPVPEPEAAPSPRSSG